MHDVPANLATPSDLRSNAAFDAAHALNSALADVVALFFKVKGFHWHVSGPHFREYHLMFDEHVAQLIAVADEIAERVRETGSLTIRSVGEVMRWQSIKDNDAEFTSPQAMLAELLEDNRSLLKSFRRVKEAADKAGDNATSGMADGWTDQAEERAWFLFEASREE